MSHWRLTQLGWLILMGLFGSVGVGSLPLAPLHAAGISESTPIAAVPTSGNSIQQWLDALSKAQSDSEKATLHHQIAQAYRQIGRLDQAIAHWESAIALYQRDRSEQGRRQEAQMFAEQAQAHGMLGQHGRAKELAEKSIALAKSLQANATEAAARGVIGNAEWALGNYDQAVVAHRDSLKLVDTATQTNYAAAGWGNLGNVLTSRAKRYQYQATIAALEGDELEEKRLRTLANTDLSDAQTAYEKSVALSESLGGITQVKALLNLNRLLAKRAESETATIDRNRELIKTVLQNQPDSRAKVYALINLATSYPTAEGTPTKGLLEKASTIAQSLGDSRAASFALGALGGWYETLGNDTKAMELTRQAQLMAQQVNAGDSLYRWQWQAGRLLRAQGDRDQAIVAYRQAIGTLQSIRSDILATNKDLQFDVRDSVEPVYRELIDLLVDDESKTKGNAGDQTLGEALGTLELLKLTELQNFFGDECVKLALERAKADDIAATQSGTQVASAQLAVKAVTSGSKLSQIDPKAAVVYSVVLNNRTVMILRMPDGTLKSYPVNISTEQLQKEVSRLRFTLEDISLESYLSQAQKMYDLLIRPMAADLAAIDPSTLVFINDGALRSIPMSALHDGKQFLVEKYAIANTLSLTLTNRKHSLAEQSNALILGLTVARPPFSALPNVGTETEQVKTILGGTRLLDQSFTLENFENQLNRGDYSIVHLATHGKFGVDGASTYLLSYDDRITLDQVESVLRRSKNPVSLLTLSACQTAAGDNRSALGIAGVAIRAGVESTLATLWFINDADTVPLIQAFYSELRQPGNTKAMALRSAQLKMIADPETRHPAIWSPMILIGNWQ